MPDFLIPISQTIGISSADIIVAFFCFVVTIVFLVSGLSRAWWAFFGACIGFGIYLVLRTLLLSTTGNDSLFSPPISKFIVGSATYLIPILTILTPLSGTFKIDGPKNIWLRILETIAVSLGFLCFLLAILFGFANHVYVFDIDTLFWVLLKTDSMSMLSAQSKALLFIVKELRSIVVIGVLVAIYKALFAEIVEAMLAAAWRAILKARKSGSESAPAPAEDHWHDEMGGQDDFEDFHDEHSHANHGHH